MAVQITIRDVPNEVRDILASRASGRGQSMQEFLRESLERLAAKPSLDVWIQGVRERKTAYETRLSADDILGAIRDDRR